LPVSEALFSRIFPKAGSVLKDSSLFMSNIFHVPPPEIPKRIKEFLASGILYPNVNRTDELLSNPFTSLVTLKPNAARGLKGVCRLKFAIVGAPSTVIHCFLYIIESAG
jgi:hypothetical protein